MAARMWDMKKLFALCFWSFHSLAVWCEASLLMFLFKISQKQWCQGTHYAKCSTVPLQKKNYFLWEKPRRKFGKIPRTSLKQSALFWRFALLGFVKKQLCPGKWLLRVWSRFTRQDLRNYWVKFHLKNVRIFIPMHFQQPDWNKNI